TRFVKNAIGGEEGSKNFTVFSPVEHFTNVLSFLQHNVVDALIFDAIRKHDFVTEFYEFLPGITKSTFRSWVIDDESAIFISSRNTVQGIFNQIIRILL